MHRYGWQRRSGLRHEALVCLRAQASLGLVRQLVYIVMRSALHPVYITMRLDTLLAMFSANALYASEGFEELSAYYQSPIAGMVLMQGHLRAWERRQHGRQSNED